MFLHLENTAYTNCAPNSNEQDSMSLLKSWIKRKDSTHIQIVYMQVEFQAET